MTLMDNSKTGSVWNRILLVAAMLFTSTAGAAVAGSEGQS